MDFSHLIFTAKGCDDKPCPTSIQTSINLLFVGGLSFSLSIQEPGYVGFANLPNQVHRKSVKRGFEFTLMVVGECLLNCTG